MEVGADDFGGRFRGVGDVARELAVEAVEDGSGGIAGVPWPRIWLRVFHVEQSTLAS